MSLTVVGRAAAALSLVFCALLGAQAPPRQPDQPQPPQPQVQQPQQQDREGPLAAVRAALQQRQFGKALELLLPLARAGNADAQTLLALLLQKGHGVAADAAAALHWYTLAAVQGHAEARFMLGQLYYRGEGTQPDQQKAADLFLLVATTGDADGEWAFGLCVTAGEGRRADPIEGHAWLSLAAQQGHEAAKQALAQSRLAGAELEQARTAAATLQQLIATRGFEPQKLPKVPVPDGMALDAAAAPAPQPAADRITGQLDIDAEILACGDLRGTATLRLPAATYREMRKLIPDPRTFLRDLASSRANEEIAPDAKARYDDAANAVVLDLHMLGAVQNRGEGRWQWPAENHAFVGVADGEGGRQVATFAFHSQEPGGIELSGRAAYRLPAGAAGVRWDDGQKQLEYQLAYAGPRGEGRLRARYAVRDRIMSCLYKVYGLDTGFAAQWVAKAVFTNTGDGPLTDLRVRFRLGDYSELDLWHKFPELVPGQTAVAAYHPVLKKQIAELTSTTPVNVVAEWRWTDAQGREREDSDGARISVLGRHEFVFSNLTEQESTGSFYDAFSNAELVAAWVTRDDPVVKQFAAAANKAAAGAGAPYSDEAAVKVLQACYELWLANDFTYQGPVGLRDEQLSFDNKIVQSMKFPRDVIRDRSGTCIEIAGLYCAMAHAVGLQPSMVLIPGHAFPAIRLPSGNLLPVECTGIGGGKRSGSAPFAKVVEIAKANYEKHAAAGDIVVVDIAAAWLRGVSNPELEPLPADILQRWGTVLEFRMSDGGGGGDAFGGQWAGTAQQPLPTGGNVQWQVVVAIGRGQDGGIAAEAGGEVRVPNGWGGSDHYQFREEYQGQLQNGVLQLRGVKKTVTVNGMQQPEQPDTLTLQAREGRLAGEMRLANGTVVTVDLQRQQR